ncbi:SMI1/KNR4 family protein [Flavobacterium aquidurense]|uniref:SMI1/KNR4 family protein n=1 Tax=Flavobacterium aquidurense TaxID=362413 RepID=UPI001040371D
MNNIQKIKHIYNLSEYENFGFSESEVLVLEKKLDIVLPVKLKEYYLELGKHENLNYSHNRLLKPDHEIGFSDDQYLVFYEENQVVAFWGIRKEDLKLDNPPIWVKYDTIEKSDWMIETKTTENFFLLMAVYNGTLGGLPYNGNFLGLVDSQTVDFVEDNFTLLPEISRKNQKVYTDDFYDLISLSFDKENNCVAVFIGTNDPDRFDDLIDSLDIDWSYLSYDDEEGYDD